MADLGFLASDWPAISLRLDEALALPPAQRDSWLAALDETDSVKGSLRRLLADAADAAGGVETDDFAPLLPQLTLGPDAPPHGPTGAAAEAGALVGPYRLIRELGVGGMGAVWLSERSDGGLKRPVALKLPHLSWTRGLAERMGRERDILASLDHPNIARIHDAGVDPQGRPYLALEYVDGIAIDAYCTRHALSVAQRLRLVVQVARALSHAHARLVVHRDLKPANILVTAEGQVRLLDFGIAKLLDGDSTEETQLTRQVGRVLTLHYASPEQIRGDAIGTASDIYSLGVVLYELLAGARPYRLPGGLGAAALADALAQIEPPRPSGVAADPAVQRQLKGDLDAIISRAMGKASSERYPTIDAFADDLERHLRGEPVSARPDSLAYRVGRWVRRHKLESAVGAAIVVAVPAGAVAQAAVLVAIGAGAGVALWQMRVARRQTRAAQHEAAHAQQVKEFALSIFQAANTDAGAGAATTAVDLLKSALGRIEAELGGRPETAVELMIAVGEGLFGLGELDTAAELLRKTVDLAERELGPRHQHTPAAKVVYGSVLVSLDRPKEAIALLPPAIAEARRQGATHRLVDGLRWLGSAQLRSGDIDAGLASARAAVDAVETASPAASKVDAASAWSWMANALNVAERDGVADAARRALVYAKELYGERITEAVLTVRLLLARGLAAEGQDAAALAELDQVLADTARFLGPTYPLVQVIHNYRAQVRLDVGDVAGAIEDFQQQLAAAARRSDSGANLGLAYTGVAKALAAGRQDQKALEHHEVGSRLLREALGPGNLHVARSLSARVPVLVRLGRLAEAEQCIGAIDDASWTAGDVDRFIHAGRVGVLRSLQGRHEEAVTLARASVEGLRTHRSKIVRATASSALGQTLLVAGHAPEAVEALREATRLFAEKQLSVSPDQADALESLAVAQAAVTQGQTPR